MGKDKTVLVTGASGFIAEYVIDELCKKGYKVIGIDKDFTNHKTIQKLDSFHHFDMVFSEKSYEAIKKVILTIKPEYVIHLASQVDVKFSQEDPEKDLINNVMSTLNLLRACKEARGVERIVFSSSASVYGDKINPSETSGLDPISNYGRSKVACEMYIKGYGIPYTIFRFSNVYGAGKSNGVIPRIINSMWYQEYFNFYGGGSQTRDFIFVEDLAQDLVKSLEFSNFRNKIVNLSSNLGSSITAVYYLIHQIMQDMGYTGERKMKHLEPIKGDIKTSILDNTELQMLFQENGYHATHTPLKTGITKMIATMQSQKKL